MKMMWNNLLMDEANPDANGGGGVSGGGQKTGGTSFLASSGQSNKADAQASSTNTASGDTKNGDAVPNNASQGSSSSDWKHALPKELQEDATLKKFTSVDALAGAYINAQKLIGADKIPVPSKHTTEAEWKEIYKKLGVPEKPDDYGVKFKEGISVDEQFSKNFVGKAHELGLLPRQAQAFAEWFSDGIAQGNAKAEQEAARLFEENTAKLKKEWGNSYDLQLNRAKKLVSEMGGEEVLNYLNASGAASNPEIIKFLAKVGETVYKEHKFVEGEGTSSTMSPKELDAQIAKLRSEPAYYDKKDPRHKAVVEEISALYKQRYDN